MKSLCVMGAACLLSAVCAVGAARAQQWTYGSPSLLPLPPAIPAPSSCARCPVVYSASSEYDLDRSSNTGPGAWRLAATGGDGYTAMTAPQPRPGGYYYTPGAAGRAAPGSRDLPAPGYSDLPAPGYGAPRGYGAAYGQASAHMDATQALWASGDLPAPAYGPSRGYRGAYEQASGDTGVAQGRWGCGDLPAPGYGAPRGYGAAYGQADEYTEAMQAPWGGGGCVGGEAAWAGSPWSCNWFAGANGLIMTRDGENHYFFSYDAADERDQLLDARQTEWGAGFEARFGRYYGCGRWAMEAAYWGLYPGAASAVVSDNDVVGSLDGILNWNQLNYNGASANVWVNDALCHRVVRDYQVHNIELNMLAFSPCASCDACCEPRMQANWVFGPRFFQFSDDLQFAADTEDRILCGDPEEIYYEIKVDNYLMGFQLGGQCKCLFAPRFRFETAAALGVYGNHMRQSSWIGGAAGTAVINNGPNAGLAFCVDSSKDDVAVLGEARVGLSCQFTRCWSGALGYRAVAVTGVALPTNQIYPDLRGIQDVAIVDSNGSLILHGCYAGVEFNY